MKQLKKRIFAGAVCDQIVYLAGENVKDPRKAKARQRFKNEQERAEHNRLVSRRKHARLINNCFKPGDLYGTLTLDDEHEVHSFDEARRIRDNYFRRLTYACPESIIFIYMGRGKSTNRIHFHIICSSDVPKELIAAKWNMGKVTHVRELREHNYYQGKDCGQDYTGLANYLFDHWTEEQGGHRYKYTRKTAKQPEAEEPTECRREYRPDRPPIPPKGYMLTWVEHNKYGYMCFHFVKKSGKVRKVE